MYRQLNKTITFITALGILVGGLSLPSTTKAVVPVSVVGTILAGPVQNIQTNTAKTASLLQELWQKEYVDDPAKWGENKAALEQMTAEYVEYVNSGFDGSPIFVTNLQNFMQEVGARTAYEFISSPELNGLSDAFEFKARVTMLTDYNKNVLKYEPKSTIDEVTNNRTQDFLDGNYDEDNYWEAWYELTQGEYNDPLRATRKVQNELGLRHLGSVANETRQLDWGSGFMTTRYCNKTTTSEGGEKRECINTTPAALVKDTVSHVLGVLPAEITLAGDELNEAIDSTYQNLSKQIISGENGLLGIGASPLSVNSYGASGQSSYLSLLGDGTAGSGPNTLYNPIEQSLKAEIEYAELQQQVVSAVTLLETKLASSTEAYPDCFELKLSNPLKNDKDSATAAIEASLTVREILELLNESFINAPDQASANAVLEQYNILKVTGLFTTDIENQAFVNEFLNIEFADRVSAFNSAIDSALKQCELEENSGGVDNTINGV